jgi:glucan biosynthesis protein
MSEDTIRIVSAKDTRFGFLLNWFAWPEDRTSAMECAMTRRGAIRLVARNERRRLKHLAADFGTERVDEVTL